MCMFHQSARDIRGINLITWYGLSLGASSAEFHRVSQPYTVILIVRHILGHILGQTDVIANLNIKCSLFQHLNSL